MRRKILLAGLAVSGLFLAGVGKPWAFARAPQGDVTEIEVTAKKYAFTPAEIHVKQGAHIRLKVTATDHDHGIDINPIPDGADKNAAPGLRFDTAKPVFKLPENATQPIEFVAEKAGTYKFKCAVFCGMGHGGMKGQIVVDP